jgi:hypothetical protein
VNKERRADVTRCCAPRPPAGRLLLPLLAGALLATGCGGKAHISGRVSFKNEPVSNGRIHFHTQDGRGPVCSALIKDGQYSAVGCPTGPAKVTIESFVTPAGASGAPPVKPELLKGFTGPDGSTTPSGRSARGLAIPDKYTKIPESGLTYTVTWGKQTKDFDLVP